MDAKPLRKLRNRRLVELRSDGENTTNSSEQSASLKRKANPDRTNRKRQRVSETAELRGSDTVGVTPRRKRKVMDDGAGPSQQKKKVQKVDPLRQEESAISSLDKGTSTDPLKGCSAFVGNENRTQLKRKADAETKQPNKKLKILDLQEKIPAEVQRENTTNSSEQNASLKRKANTDRTNRKRQRVSETAELRGSDTVGVTPRRKRKVMDDGAGPSQQKKKVQKVDPLRQEESAISSVDKGTSTDLLEGCSAFVGNESQTQLKRKADVETKQPKKKLRKILDLQEKIPAEVQRESSTDPLEGCSAFVNDVTKTQVKRKANAETERPSKRIKKSVNPQKKVSPEVQRAQFQAKYRQEQHLEDGGFGCVYAGYRIADELPVAIKHVPKDKVLCKQAGQNGLSVEVAVMVKLSDGTEGPVGTSTSVSLLDWYDFGCKLVLVLERPDPCEDLFTYIMTNGGPLPEEEAKIIVTQLIEGLTELHNNKIFHRDIKIENILIETGSDMPRARLIDFGLSCFFKTKSVYRNFYGTLCHVPPEFVTHRMYRPGPTTVWQLGVVLYEMLHYHTRFETVSFLCKEQTIDDRLSENCQDFLKMCLSKTPMKRPSLEELYLHPWLRQDDVNTPSPDSRI